MFATIKPHPHLNTLIRRPAHIDAVQVEMGDSLYLNINGYHNDSSRVPTRIEQRRSGQHIAVRLFREWDADAVFPAGCAFFDDSIALDGDFKAGTYTIDVNGHIITLVI